MHLDFIDISRLKKLWKKKSVIFLLVILSIIMISACASSIDRGKNSDKDIISHERVIIDAGENYKIYNYSRDEFVPDIELQIFDNNAIELKKINCHNRPYGLEYVSDDILMVSISGGTNATKTVFFDVANSNVSDEYSNLYYYDKNIVSYISFEEDKTYVCVKDMFDRGLMLKAELDMGGITTTGEYEIDIKENIVIVQHYRGAEYKMITETFVIETNKN